MSQLVNLFVDIGHSCVKWRTPESAIKTISVTDFQHKLLPRADNLWLSCVAYENIAKEINNSFDNVVNIKTIKNFKGINIAYEIPSKMGVDRFLAILAANNYHPKQNLLIIDIGSAITIDVLNKDGKHQGGLIMPGIKALRKSFDKFSTNNDLMGFSGLKKNTKDSWLSGTESMIIVSIKNQLNNFLSNYPKGKIVFTGSNANTVAKYIDENITIYNNLVLDGIEYYANNN